MFENKSRRGLAIGAAVSLIASVFAGLPASAAVDVELKLDPFAGTSTATFVTEEFSLVAYPANAEGTTQIGRLAYYVEKASTVSTVLYSATSATASMRAASSSYKIAASTATESVIIPTTSEAVVGKQNIFIMKLEGASTSSASIDIKVTAFVDANSNGKFDAADVIRSSTRTVSFKKFSDVTSTVALTTPIAGDTNVYGTGSITGLNNDQLSGKLEIVFGHSSSAGVTTSYSVVVDGSTFSTVSALVANQSVSAALVYNNGAKQFLGSTISKAVVAATIKGVTVSAPASDNVLQSAAGEGDARVNSAWSLTAYGYTGSGAVTTSVKIESLKLKVTVSPALTSTRSITINGVTYTDSAKLPTSSALVQGTDGKAVISVSTIGWENAQSASFTVTGENFSNTMQVELQTPTYSVTSDNGAYASTALGGSVALALSVKDQWDALSTRTGQRIKLVVTGSTGFTAPADQILTVSGGKATATVTAVPNSISGTLTATAYIQTQTLETGNWVDGNSTAITIAVASTANSFSTKPAASYSASISYGTAMSWSSITANVGVTGSSVVISGTGLIFKANAKTYSDTVTVLAQSGGLVSFDVASRKAGSYTISFLAGSATASTQLVVAPAADTAGKSITFDTSAIAAGATKVITGTLVDENGNPVHTSGSAKIAVTYTVASGTAGIPIGTLPDETDADGKFSFTVFTGASDKGFATLTVKYYKSGVADTAAKDVLTAAQSIGVGQPAAAPAAKLTVGSFKGFLAIYASGYEGKKLSYKVAGKWGSVASLKAFERVVRKTGAGYTVKVDLYVDGSLVKSETVTTK